jgi:hypothetical protein
MADVTIPHTFTGGTTISAPHMNENFTAITDQVNGNLDSDNMALPSPYFRAYRSAAHSRTDGQTVIFDSETDPNGWYNSATGVFLPTKTGMYRVSWTVTLAAAPTGAAIMTATLVGQGATAVGAGSFASAGEYTSVGIQLHAFNGATDSVHVELTHTLGGSIALNTGSAGSADNHFEAEYIGP